MSDLSDVLHGLCLGILIGTTAIGIAVVVSGSTYSDGVDSVRMEALEAGVAEWPRNGEFRWKEVTE